VEPKSEVRKLHLEADGDSREVRITALSGELPADLGAVAGALGLPAGADDVRLAADYLRRAQDLL